MTFAHYTMIVVYYTVIVVHYAVIFAHYAMIVVHYALAVVHYALIAWGGLAYLIDGDALRNFQKKSLKVTIVGVAPANFIP